MYIIMMAEEELKLRKNMSICGKDELYELLSRSKEELGRFGIEKIGFFGSFARGEADKNSDVDIVVEFEEGKATFRNISALVEYLENLLNRPVDILTPSGIESIRVDTVRERIEKEVIYV